MRSGQSATSQFENDFWLYLPEEDDWVEKTTYGGSPRKGTSASVAGGLGYVARGELADGGSGNDLWQYRPTVLAPEYSQSIPEEDSHLYDEKGMMIACNTQSRYVGLEHYS